MRLETFMNKQLPEEQTSFRKSRETRDHIVNQRWIMKAAKERQKDIFCFIDYNKAFDCVDHDLLF